MKRLRMIISGGQTGVDRAALDAGRQLGIAGGGWCPKGSCAEDGMIPLDYPMQETPNRDYAQRTEWNVRDADATLILTVGSLAGGTALTAKLAKSMVKPCLIVRLDGSEDVGAVRRWLCEHGVEILNVAGPRESEQSDIYVQAKSFLINLLEV